MKISFAAACPDIKLKDGMPLYRGKLEDVLPILKDTGYNAVELFVKSPDKLNRENLARLCKKNGLKISMLCTGEVYGEDGLSLISPDKSVREKTVNRMEDIIRLASYLNTDVNIGRVRGNFCKGAPREKSLKWAASNFLRLSEFARRYKVNLLLEPINRFQCNFINTTQEGINMVSRVNCDNFRLMIDLFHMNIEDVSIEGSIRESKKYLGYVHVCDSNRQAPGMGHLDFHKIITALKSIGYSGYLSGEILPIPDDYHAAVLTLKNLKRLLK